MTDCTYQVGTDGGTGIIFAEPGFTDPISSLVTLNFTTAKVLWEPPYFSDCLVGYIYPGPITATAISSPPPCSTTGTYHCQ